MAIAVTIGAMANDISPLHKLRAEILSGSTAPRDLAERALAKSNQNAGRNVYISRDENWTLREADRVQKEFPCNEFSAGAFPFEEKPPLFGLPVSLKDCFDLEGFRTTAGTRYYAKKTESARADSAVKKKMREQGAVIPGKTNLHPLAYGTPGENPDLGDCLQPADATLLTGGSTSGGLQAIAKIGIF